MSKVIRVKEWAKVLQAVGKNMEAGVEYIKSDKVVFKQKKQTKF